MIFHRAGKYDYLHAVRQIWRGRALFRRCKDNMQAERHHGDEGGILAHATKCGSRTSQTDKARNCVLGSARLCDA